MLGCQRLALEAESKTPASVRFPFFVSRCDGWQDVLVPAWNEPDLR